MQKEQFPSSTVNVDDILRVAEFGGRIVGEQRKVLRRYLSNAYAGKGNNDLSLETAKRVNRICLVLGINLKEHYKELDKIEEGLEGSDLGNNLPIRPPSSAFDPPDLNGLSFKEEVRFS